MSHTAVRNGCAQWLVISPVVVRTSMIKEMIECQATLNIPGRYFCPKGGIFAQKQTEDERRDYIN